MKDFNPEPWVRSLLWLALTIAVVIAVIFNKTPVKIGGAGVQVEIGRPGEAERPLPPTAVTTSGAPSVRRGSGSVFASACPARTRAIGGSCIVKSGAGLLQNFGPEKDASGIWQFVCVWAWTPNAGVDGYAQAVCLPDPT